MTRRFAGVHFIFIPDRRRIQNSLISVATAYQPGINARENLKNHLTIGIRKTAT